MRKDLNVFTIAENGEIRMEFTTKNIQRRRLKCTPELSYHLWEDKCG